MTKYKKIKATSDAVTILKNRYYVGKPSRIASLEAERLNARIAGLIYDLRTQAKLTQKQLAAIIGTTESVICRLEDADYEGHSFPMLKRIALAFGARIEIHFVPADPKQRYLTAPKGSRIKLEEVIA